MTQQTQDAGSTPDLLQILSFDNNWQKSKYSKIGTLLQLFAE